jgi:cephalosporin hydroxylase
MVRSRVGTALRAAEGDQRHELGFGDGAARERRRPVVPALVRRVTAATTGSMRRIWQNVLDLWSLQEASAHIRPKLPLEPGTNRGGSALFYAHLFDLLGEGRVVTVDVERLHDLTHPRTPCAAAGCVRGRR